MKSGKDIDFTKVDFITYAVDEYLNDIPMYELVSHYVALYKRDENCCEGMLNGYHVVVNTNTNKCYVDGELFNGEQFVLFVEGEDIDPCQIIKRITSIDLDDYISDVTYSDGTVEYLDVKGKKFFIGGWKKERNDDR